MACNPTHPGEAHSECVPSNALCNWTNLLKCGSGQEIWQGDLELHRNFVQIKVLVMFGVVWMEFTTRISTDISTGIFPEWNVQLIKYFGILVCIRK